ncbi:GIY-YIG nuclease family protein [Microcoleus sp. F6_B4]
MNSKPKPILKLERIPKKIKKQNHYKPGFVYLFHDPLAVITKGVTLCKAGLSGKPKRRRYYLSQEYQSDLIIKAIAPTMNMRLTEILIHKIFQKHNVLRQQGLDGYTEWFAVDFLRIIQMQTLLYLVAIAVNFLYLVVVVLMTLTLVQILF